MGFQFIHVEGYARHAGKGKAGGHTVASVMAEATREPGACPHVEHPSPPVLLFGCPLAEVEAEASEWAANSVDAIGRKLRKDGLGLLGGVLSAPDEMTAEDWESMKRDAIAWLNRDGRLLSVAEHTDESHRHVHFYKVPAPGERFETLHPGRAASLAAKAGGAVKGRAQRPQGQGGRARRIASHGSESGQGGEGRGRVGEGSGEAGEVGEGSGRGEVAEGFASGGGRAR